MKKPDKNSGHIFRINIFNKNPKNKNQAPKKPTFKIEMFNNKNNNVKKVDNFIISSENISFSIIKKEKENDKINYLGAIEEGKLIDKIRFPVLDLKGEISDIHEAKIETDIKAKICHGNELGEGINIKEPIIPGNGVDIKGKGLDAHEQKSGEVIDIKEPSGELESINNIINNNMEDNNKKENPEIVNYLFYPQNIKNNLEKEKSKYKL